MASRRISRKPPSAPCSQWTDEDGIDPRFLSRGPRGEVTNRKSLQLCRQVERALAVALDGEVLRDLSVRSVQPAPDSSRLLVTFAFHGDEKTASSDILTALALQRAKLRSVIAAAICRKKTPELAFHVVRA